MFAVSIAFGTHSWRMLFKDEEKANKAYELASQPATKTHEFSAPTAIALIDDFGQRATFRLDSVIGTMLENLDESKVANIEMALHQQRTQMSFQQRAEADPTIRAARASGGPAIISPMGGRLS